MEPKFSPLESAPEKAPQSPEQVSDSERQFDIPLPSPEQGEQRGAETVQAPSAPTPLPTVSLSLPTPVPIVTGSQQTAVDDDLPKIAADEDLIEKEWVDKAKKIIAETKDDPHKREKEVGRLQTDYLKKRYGKELGASS